MPTARRPVLRLAGTRPALQPWLVAAGFALLGVGWLVATPPASGPDERAHLIKALGVGRGEWAGTTAKAPTSEALRQLFALDPRARRNLAAVTRDPSVRWQTRTRRDFRVPAHLLDPRFGCTAGRPAEPATCLSRPSPPNRSGVVSSYVGTYQPYLYVPAGLATRAAGGPWSAIWLGRLSLLVPSLALLGAAVLVLWSGVAPSTSLLGLALAVTPMVLFLAAMLSPSGPEIAGAICFAAALLRLVRPEPPPRGIWVALGAGGAVLASARALGPPFVLVLLVSVGLLGGPRTLGRALRAGGVRAILAGVVILAAAIASLVWEFDVQPRPSPSGGGALDAFGPSLSHLPDVGEQAIGVFGKLDAPMPYWGHAVWTALLLVLLGAALVAGSIRDRVSIVALVVGIVAAVLVMSVVYREIGPLHGRYALPILVLLPLWLGEVVHRRRARLPATERSVLTAAVFLGTGVVHILGLWALAERFAVGRGHGWLFFDRAAWAPPLGWWPWVLVALAAAAAYFAAGGAAALDAARLEPRRRRTS
jgi:hypothetical protein